MLDENPKRKPYYYSLLYSRSSSKERYSLILPRGSVSRRPEDFPEGTKILVVRRKGKQGKPTLVIEEYNK